MQSFSVSTRSRSQLMDISGQVQEAVSKSGVKEGVCVVFVPHTTAGVTINENADPSVRADIEEMLDKLIPWRAGYKHGEGNSAAHIKSTLVGSSVHIPVDGGGLALGTWQGVYFCEFDGPRSRRFSVCVVPVAG